MATLVPITTALQDVVDGFDKSTASENDIKWLVSKLPEVELRPAIDMNELRGMGHFKIYS